MRQAGLKPKSHSSGVYWTRAASNNAATNKAEIHADDWNGDGVVDEWDVIAPVLLKAFFFFLTLILVCIWAFADYLI